MKKPPKQVWLLQHEEWGRYAELLTTPHVAARYQTMPGYRVTEYALAPKKPAKKAKGKR